MINGLPKKLSVLFLTTLLWIGSCTLRPPVLKAEHTHEHETFVLSCEAFTCTPSPALEKLFKVLHISHNGSLEDMVSKTQSAWLRPRDEERWHMRERYSEQEGKIRPLLADLGLLKEARSQAYHYNYALLLGASAETMKERIAFLQSELRRGVRFDSLIVLGAQRPLDPNTESGSIAETQKTETDMIKALLQETQDEVLQAIPRTIVDTPMKELKDGRLARPTTGDTINSWLLLNPKPGSVLAISNQPYVQYQDAVLKTLMPPDFSVETIGPPAAAAELLSVHLDNLARTLYQNHQRLIKKR